MRPGSDQTKIRKDQKGIHITMQAMTLAISSMGIEYFVDQILEPTIYNSLLGLTAPNMTVYPSGYTKTGISASPYTYPDQYTYSDIVVNLTNGTLSNYTPAYQGYTQQSGGVFQLTFLASNVGVNYTWNESYELTTYDPTYNKTTGPDSYSATYDFTMTIGTLTLTVDLTLSASSTEYTLAVSSVSSDPQNIDPDWPSGSVVVTSQSCTGDTVDGGMEQAIDNIDFSSALNTVLSPLWGSVSATGDLGNGITFDWAPGDDPLAFPNNSGLTLGITGQVSYDGTAYSAETAPSIALPSMPTDNYVHFDVSDYEFNALNWGYFEAGLLTQEIAASDLPDPQMLNTSNYCSLVAGLCEAYPNAPMSLTVTPTEAPTVSFQQIYEITDTSLATLESEVPSDVYTELTYFEGIPYLDATSFANAVEPAIGSDNWTTYGAVIEAAAELWAGVFEHQVQGAFYIAYEDPVYLFTAQFDLVYVESAFVLGSSGSQQTVQFDFTLVTSSTQASLVDSNYQPINILSFPALWNTGFEPAYADTMAALGSQGVPLPYMQGFEFLFDSATVTVEEGLVSVVANLEYED